MPGDHNSLARSEDDALRLTEFHEMILADGAVLTKR